MTLPLILSAHPAKCRKVAAAFGISSAAGCPTGLPTSRASRRARRSESRSIRSATAESSLPRLTPGMAPQSPLRAARAALTAPSTSPSVAAATVASGNSVEGLMSANVAFPVAGRQSPPTKRSVAVPGGRAPFAAPSCNVVIIEPFRAGHSYRGRGTNGTKSHPDRCPWPVSWLFAHNFPAKDALDTDRTFG